MQQAKTQRDDRLPIVAEDQFGRPWMFKIEKKTMEITGDIQPCKWDPSARSAGIDPLRTPQKYFHLPRLRNGMPDVGRVRVDYDTWIEDTKVGLRDWVTHLWNTGQQLNPGARTIYEIEKDPRCLHWAGNRPWPSTRILELAKAGNKQLLGLAPLTAETQKLLRQISVETILRDELDAFSEEEQQAFGLLKAQTPSSPDQTKAVPDVTRQFAPVPGMNYQRFIKAAAAAGIPFRQALDRWKAYRSQVA